MLEIAFRFGSYGVLALFLVAGAAGTLGLAWLWPRLAPSDAAPRKLGAAAAAFLVLNAGVFAAWAATVRLDSDEVEHLHCAWLISQGLVPFRDFWQAHSPMLWYLLAPLVAPFHSAAVLPFARLLAGALFLVFAASTGWLTWRLTRDHTPAARSVSSAPARSVSSAPALLSALLVLGLGVRLEGAWIRPDQLASILIVISFGALIGGSAAGPSRAAVFLSGAAFGFALSLTPKAFLATLAFPLVAVFWPGFELRRRLELPLFYMLGGIAGALPLFALLARLGITSEWFTWTFAHHASKGRLESGFPLALAIVAVAGGYGALRLRREFPTVLLAAAFALQTVGTALIPYRVAADLMLWASLATVLAAPLLLDWIRKGERRRLALLAGAAFALMQIEAWSPLVTRRTLGDFASDRARLAWMIEQAGDRPVVLVTPVHTIFSRDATGLYHLWQYSHWLRDPLVSRSLAGFAQQIEQSRPALIAAAPRRITDDPEATPTLRPRLFDSLAHAGLLTEAEWQRIMGFVTENYVVTERNGELFFVLSPKSKVQSPKSSGQ